MDTPMTPKERGILAGLANRDFFSANPYVMADWGRLDDTNDNEWRQGYYIGRKLLESIKVKKDDN